MAAVKVSCWQDSVAVTGSTLLSSPVVVILRSVLHSVCCCLTTNFNFYSVHSKQNCTHKAFRSCNIHERIAVKCA
jgi:hypothetical protein